MERMKNVSRFEANLLRILHGLLGRAPIEQVLPLVLQPMTQPRCLSRNALSLVQDCLAKGCVHWLARIGGWRRARHPRGDKAAEGRLWERTTPADLALRFSRHSLAFLLWLTASRPVVGSNAWRAPVEELTAADQLLLFLAYQALRDTEAADGLRALPAVRGNLLVGLAFPQDFLHCPELAACDFLPWTTGLAGCMLEGMQHLLAQCWIELDRAKARIVDWEAMQALGRAQGQVLTPFLDALEQTRRFDLARFILEAIAALLPPDAAPRFWVGGLTSAGPRLADRSATYGTALVFIRELGRLRGWERQARGVGYFDDGYAVAQLWKSDWERYEGEVLWARAETIARLLEPLPTTGGAES
jgi:hypothetical protein